MASYPDWNTFSAKGSADLSFGASGSLSASTQLRMVRGEVLQISVRIILGIEVARLYMTPDSLFLVNKMQKQYVAASLQEIGGGCPVLFRCRPFKMLCWDAYFY